VLGFNGRAPSLVASKPVVGIAITMLACGFAGFYGRTACSFWRRLVLTSLTVESRWHQRRYVQVSLPRAVAAAAIASSALCRDA
jgi:hypothetical protein